MDNHIFRNAPWGFNRQDVMEYIEKTQRDGEAAAAALTSLRIPARTSERFPPAGRKAPRCGWSRIPPADADPPAPAGQRSAADAQASDALAQAQARRAALLEETQTQIESSARQCGLRREKQRDYGYPQAVGAVLDMQFRDNVIASALCSPSFYSFNDHMIPLTAPFISLLRHAAAGVFRESWKIFKMP